MKTNVTRTNALSARWRVSGRETLLDEELTEEQVEEELSPVTVQLAYTAAQLGEAAEAISTYEVSMTSQDLRHEGTVDAINRASELYFEMCLQGVMRNGTEDDAVIAVASNNWVAERLLSEGDAASKKLCVDLLKKFEGLFEKVSSHDNYGALSSWSIFISYMPS